MNTEILGRRRLAKSKKGASHIRCADCDCSIR
ncbi:hypothetical protein E6H31_06475 [Candidatus Bathyarchaeota archaeon]|nr:MAG: hypothetical protein E6H31_06475 [Candidatus Bathyarchaeota archaeon]